MINENEIKITDTRTVVGKLVFNVADMTDGWNGREFQPVAIAIRYDRRVPGGWDWSATVSGFLYNNDGAIGKRKGSRTWVQLDGQVKRTPPDWVQKAINDYHPESRRRDDDGGTREVVTDPDPAMAKDS